MGKSNFYTGSYTVQVKCRSPRPSPALVRISNDRLTKAVNASGHLTVGPALIVEVLSDLPEGRQKDHEHKLKLYSAKGVTE